VPTDEQDDYHDDVGQDEQARTQVALVRDDGGGDRPEVPQAVQTAGTTSPGGVGARARVARVRGAGAAYFGVPGLPDRLAQIPVETVERAASWLLARDDVGLGRVAVMGQSRGGELALLAGASLDVIGAVVGVVLSGVVWCGVVWLRRGRSAERLCLVGWRQAGSLLACRRWLSVRCRGVGARCDDVGIRTTAA